MVWVGINHHNVLANVVSSVTVAPGDIDEGMWNAVDHDRIDNRRGVDRW